MIHRILSALVLALLAVAPVQAQTVAGDRLTLTTGPCTIRSGSGDPEGAVTGKVCDIWVRTNGSSSGIIYAKTSGTGNTGWLALAAIPLDATPGKVFISGSPVSWSANPPLTGITGAGSLTFFPAGDLIINPTGNDVLPDTNYDINLGQHFKKFLSLHIGELFAETLVAQDVMATIGGRIIVAPTTLLTADLGSGASSMVVKHNNLANGDRVLMQASPGGSSQVEWMAITSSASGSAGAYTYSVTRNLDGTGANDWAAGDAVLNTGTTYSNIAPRWAAGNLNGVGYGHATDIYGFAAGNPSGAYTYLDDTSGLVMGGPSGVRVSITPSGVATFVGDGDGVTNIDGGNIQTNTITATQIAAATITGDKVAANTLTVGNLNATGFGNNVIKNGSFEPSVGQTFGATGLAGWAKDVNGSTSSAAITNITGGISGPGRMFLDPGNSFYMSATYLAFPVTPGDTYRVSVQVAAAATSAAALNVLALEYDTATAGVQRVVFDGAGAVATNDVEYTSFTALAISASVTSGWQALEYSYTVPSGVYWVSLSLSDVSGSFSSSTYTELAFDDVEVVRRIGPGHIQANSITAGQIAANAITTSELDADSVTSAKIAANTIVAGDIAAGTITATEIAANTITAAKIAAGTITATELAANSVTSAKIDANTITASDIAAGTITGTEIAASTITAGKLSVSTLDAISANLGTITAGSISGTTIQAGSGNEVVLDSGGITLDAGGGTNNKLKWDDGVSINSIGGSTGLQVSGGNAFFSDNVYVQSTSLAGPNLTANWIQTDYTLGFLNPPISTAFPVYWDSGCTCLVRQSSSARYKDNVRPWDGFDPLAILNVPLVRFDFKMPADSKLQTLPSQKNQIGVLAEDLIKLAPDAVLLDANGRPDGVKGGALEYYLLAALKAEDAKVKALETRVAALEALVKSIVK